VRTGCGDDIQVDADLGPQLQELEGQVVLLCGRILPDVAASGQGGQNAVDGGGRHARSLGEFLDARPASCAEGVQDGEGFVE